MLLLAWVMFWVAFVYWAWMIRKIYEPRHDYSLAYHAFRLIGGLAMLLVIDFIYPNFFQIVMAVCIAVCVVTFYFVHRYEIVELTGQVIDRRVTMMEGHRLGPWYYVDLKLSDKVYRTVRLRRVLWQPIKKEDWVRVKTQFTRNPDMTVGAYKIEVIPRPQSDTDLLTENE